MLHDKPKINKSHTDRIPPLQLELMVHFVSMANGETEKPDHFQKEFETIFSSLPFKRFLRIIKNCLLHSRARSNEMAASKWK